MYYDLALLTFNCALLLIAKLDDLKEYINHFQNGAEYK